MPRPLKQGILGDSTTILSKDIDKYAFMCGSNFYETDVSSNILQINEKLYFEKKNERKEIVLESI